MITFLDTKKKTIQFVFYKTKFYYLFKNKLSIIYNNIVSNIHIICTVDIFILSSLM